jgi:bla regulator protein BlaR1
MDTMWASLGGVFGWVVRASIYAAAAIIIIVLVQTLTRQLLPARWSYALWLILLGRLVLPAGPECSLSVWNFVPRWTHWMSLDSYANKTGATDRAFFSRGGVSLSTAKPGSISPPASNYALIQKNKEEEKHQISQNDSIWVSVLQLARNLLPGIWLAGALSLMIGIAVSNLRLWNSVRKLRLMTDQTLLELLEDCKQQMQVRTIVGLVVTERVKSPSLFGFIRPRVLLPTGLARHVPTEELRYIFLHELAHLKRCDILIGWV